ncbi:MAG: RDD family protein [Rhodospirillales bacterium]|jgi:uncharacterized RDD family membrane protein YckC
MTDLPAAAPPPLRKKPDFRPFDGVLWRRVAAYLADLILVSLLCLPIGFLLFLGGFATFGLLWGPLPFLWLGVNAAYYTLLVSGRESSTLGQRLMGLRVLSTENQSPLLFQAFLQVFLFYASVFIATPLVLLIGLFNAKGSLVHDMLSGLVVGKTIQSTTGNRARSD